MKILSKDPIELINIRCNLEESQASAAYAILCSFSVSRNEKLDIQYDAMNSKFTAKINILNTTYNSSSFPTKDRAKLDVSMKTLTSLIKNGVEYFKAAMDPLYISILNELTMSK